MQAALTHGVSPRMSEPLPSEGEQVKGGSNTGKGWYGEGKEE